MDLHPLVVHFPIALLTIYSILECVRPLTKAFYWARVRAVLVITGAVGAFASLSTGETAEHLFQNRELHDVLEMHAAIGNITTWIYAILAAGYLLLWLNVAAQNSLPNPIKNIASMLQHIARFITETPLAILLAILGFIGLTLTGALGAILVYGPEFDPITKLVYSLLF